MTRLSGTRSGPSGGVAAGRTAGRTAGRVEVRQADDAPTQFLWGDQLYLVRAVLDHWVESGGWWTATAESLTGPSGPDVGCPGAGLTLVPIPPAPKWGQRAWGEPAPDIGASVGPAGVDDREREYWRVEADRGRWQAETVGSGVYDLCLDWSSGTWSLARVLD